MTSFKDCLENKRIFRFEPAKQLVTLEIEDAESDLRSAKEEFSKSGFKWRFSKKRLNSLQKTVERRKNEIIKKWKAHFKS